MSNLIKKIFLFFILSFNFCFSMENQAEDLFDKLLDSIYYEKLEVIELIKNLYISKNITKEDIQNIIKLKLYTKIFYADKFVGPVTVVFAKMCEKVFLQKQSRLLIYEQTDFDRKILAIIT